MKQKNKITCPECKKESPAIHWEKSNYACMVEEMMESTECIVCPLCEKAFALNFNCGCYPNWNLEYNYEDNL